MRRHVRGHEPELLARYADEVGRTYAERRALDPTARFEWPTREGLSLREAAHAALSRDTDGHCAYCDGHPLDAQGRAEVDHFRPKSEPQFYRLVCVYSNLFLACTACNTAKRETWSDALLRPDASDYEFARYFVYDTGTGELSPSPAASAEDRERAQTTIAVLGLNRPGLRSDRRRWLRSWSDESVERPYRFLFD